jgi:hypothetical protein
MAEAEKSLGAVRFGLFELLLETQELRKHGIPLKLSGQAIQITSCFDPVAVRCPPVNVSKS